MHETLFHCFPSKKLHRRCYIMPPSKGLSLFQDILSCFEWNGKILFLLKENFFLYNFNQSTVRQFFTDCTERG